MKTVASLLETCEKLKSKLVRGKEAGGSAAEQQWLLRQQLQECYKDLLIRDLDQALEQKLELQLWNLAFRAQLNEMDERKAAGRGNGGAPSKDEIRLSRKMFLEMARGFYLQLFHGIASAFDVDTRAYRFRFNFGVDASPTGGKIDFSTTSRRPRHQQMSPVAPSSANVKYILQYCLIHLGDIARYIHKIEEGHALAAVYLDEARVFYQHAIDTMPHNGHAYNQLAILEQQAGDKLSMVYLYCRSLAVKNPFNGSEKNLEKYLRRLCGEQQAAAGDDFMTTKDAIAVFVQLHALIVLTDNFSRFDEVLQVFQFASKQLFKDYSLSWLELIQCVVINLYCQRWLKSAPMSKLSRCRSILSCFIDALLHNLLKSELPLPRHALLYPLRIALLSWTQRDVYDLDNDRLCRNLCELYGRLEGKDAASSGGEEQEAAVLEEDLELRGFAPLAATCKSNNTVKTGSNASESAQEIVRVSQIRALCRQIASFSDSPIKLDDETGNITFTGEISGDKLSELDHLQPPWFANQVITVPDKKMPDPPPFVAPALAASISTTPTRTLLFAQSGGLRTAKSTPPPPIHQPVAEMIQQIDQTKENAFLTEPVPPASSPVAPGMSFTRSVDYSGSRPLRETGAPVNRSHLPPRLRKLLDEEERSKRQAVALKEGKFTIKPRNDEQNYEEEQEGWPMNQSVSPSLQQQQHAAFHPHQDDPVQPPPPPFPLFVSQNFAHRPQLNYRPRMRLPFASNNHMQPQQQPMMFRTPLFTPGAANHPGFHPNHANFNNSFNPVVSSSQATGGHAEKLPSGLESLINGFHPSLMRQQTQPTSQQPPPQPVTQHRRELSLDSDIERNELTSGILRMVLKDDDLTTPTYDKEFNLNNRIAAGLPTGMTPTQDKDFPLLPNHWQSGAAGFGQIGGDRWMPPNG